MRSRKTSPKKKRSSALICALIGFLMLRPFMWAQTEVKLSAVPELGKHIVVPRGAELGVCMSSPGQLDKCLRATVNGIRYTVAFRRRGLRGNVATHIYTDDPSFKSPEGLRVGGVVTVEDPENILVAPGFEIYGRKGKGWVPVVGFNGEVNLVHEGQADEKREAKTLTPTTHNPVRLRIKGFTMRGNPPEAHDGQKSNTTTR